MTAYELWTHRWTAAFYAIRFEDGRVTGVCGPLPFATLAGRGDLASLQYDERPEAIECALRHPEQFAPAEAWRRGRAEGTAHGSQSKKSLSEPCTVNREP